MCIATKEKYNQFNTNYLQTGPATHRQNETTFTIETQ